VSLNPDSLDFFTIDADTLDISPDVLDDHGRIRVLPAAFWATTTAAERAPVRQASRHL
jgi:hypothetical protein